MGNLLNNFELEIKKIIPKFSVDFKDQSLFMKIISYLVYIFNRKFMTSYITTIYPKVYFPNQEKYNKLPTLNFKVLAHEFVHLFDAKDNSLLFSLKYLFPQILALPFIVGAVLLAIFVSWSMFFISLIVGLIFLVPWRAYWRSELEYRGYAMTLACEYWMNGDISDWTINHCKEQFYGWAYYRMDGDTSRVNAKINKIVEDIKSGKILEGKENIPYKIVNSFLLKEGIILR